MTRLTKSRSLGGANPKVRPNQSVTFPTGSVGSTIVTSGVNESTPLNTTTSPRWMSRRWNTTLLTRTRSPISSVFCIDPLGM